MRIVRPNEPATVKGGRLDGSKYVPGKPQWLREWQENQRHYVMLSCGHKDDINSRGILIIKALLPVGKTSHYDVFCEPCNAFKRVKRNMTKYEYLGITPAEIPDEPLF